MSHSTKTVKPTKKVVLVDRPKTTAPSPGTTTTATAATTSPGTGPQPDQLVGDYADNSELAKLVGITRKTLTFDYLKRVWAGLCRAGAGIPAAPEYPEANQTKLMEATMHYATGFSPIHRAAWEILTTRRFGSKNPDPAWFTSLVALMSFTMAIGQTDKWLNE